MTDSISKNAAHRAISSSRALSDMTRLFNGQFCKASKKTIEAFSAFKAAAKEDVAFLFRQASMYKQTPEERAAKNLAGYQLREEKRKVFERDIFNCKTCRDTGRKRGGAFCTCAAGRELLTDEKLKLYEGHEYR